MRIAAIFGAILTALLAGLVWLYPTQNRTPETRFEAGGSTICDEFMRSMPPFGNKRIEAGKPCVEALPNLDPEDQLRILNSYVSDVPGYIQLESIDALIAELDPDASLPLRAFNIRYAINEVDEAQFAQVRALVLEAEEANNQPALANALYAEQIIPLVTGALSEFEDAQIERALDIAGREDMRGLEPYLYNFWALVLNLRGDYVQSIDHYQTAAKGFEANQDYEGIALALTNLSYIYADFQDSDKAIDIAQEAIQVLEDNKVESGERLIAALEASADHLSLAERYSEAMKAYEQVLILAEKDGLAMPRAQASRIFALYNTGEEDAAMKQAETLLQSDSLNPTDHIIRELQIWLGARHAEAGDSQKVQEYFQAVRELAPPGGGYIEDTLEATNNEQFALEMGQDFLLLLIASGQEGDAIKLAKLLNERQKNHVETSKVNAIAGHDLQTTIKALALEAERNELELVASRLQLALAALTAVLLGIFAWQFYRSSKTQRQLVETKETFLQEIHHRTKNNLQVLTSMLSLDIRRAERGERSEGARQEAVNRVQMMGLIHDHLYNVSADSEPKVAIDEFMDELLALLDASFGRPEVELTWYVAPGELDAARATPFGLLVCELVTNSFKHAFDEKGGMIDVCARIEDGQLSFQMSDNGRGFELEKALKKKESLGMQLSFDLAEQAGGKLSVKSSSEGTNWTFR